MNARERLHTPEGIAHWMKQCGFETNQEAQDALGIPARSWYRHKAKGLPKGSIGNAIALAMEGLRRERWRKRRAARGARE